MSESAAPIACKLSGQAFSERAGAIKTLLAESDGRQELADGYAFRFPGDFGEAARLLDFITEERDCCPFFAFELVFEPAGGPIWLRVRGPEDARSLIEGMTR